MRSYPSGSMDPDEDFSQAVYNQVYSVYKQFEKRNFKRMPR